MPVTFQEVTANAIRTLTALADFHDNQASEADAMDCAGSANWHDARRAEVNQCIDVLNAALRNESPPSDGPATEPTNIGTQET